MAAFLWKGCVVPSSLQSQPHQWHTGESVPKDINESRVVTLQADGDELDVIMHALNNTCQRLSD